MIFDDYEVSTSRKTKPSYVKNAKVHQSFTLADAKELVNKKVNYDSILGFVGIDENGKLSYRKYDKTLELYVQYTDDSDKIIFKTMSIRDYNSMSCTDYYNEI